MPESATEMGVLQSDSYWRFDLPRRRAEYVRRSDGFVLDSRVMTREEVERATIRQASPKPASAEPRRSNMPSDAEIRNQNLIGQEWNNLTLKALAGQHPTSGAFFGDFECKCGNPVKRVMISEVRNGRKPDCGAKCPLRVQPLRSHGLAAKPERGVSQKRTAKAPKKPRKSVEPTTPVEAKSPEPQQQNGNQPTTTVNWRNVLVDEAALLRRTAVAILTGKVKDPQELARAMRDQADTLDEIVYAV